MSFKGFPLSAFYWFLPQLDFSYLPCLPDHRSGGYRLALTDDCVAPTGMILQVGFLSLPAEPVLNLISSPPGTGFVAALNIIRTGGFTRNHGKTLLSKMESYPRRAENKTAGPFEGAGRIARPCQRFRLILIVPERNGMPPDRARPCYLSAHRPTLLSVLLFCCSYCIAARKNLSPPFGKILLKTLSFE